MFSHGENGRQRWRDRMKQRREREDVRDGGCGEMMDSEGGQITVNAIDGEDPTQRRSSNGGGRGSAGRVENGKLNSIVPPRMVGRASCKHLPTQPPPSKPVVGPFLRWDTHAEHSRLAPQLFIWLRDEERHWRNELLDQSRSGLVHACRMKTFRATVKMLGSRGRQEQEREKA